MKKLYDVFEEITPDSFASIQNKLQDRKENVIVEMPRKEHQNYLRYAILPLVVIVAFVVLIMPKPTTVVATVGIDVNPSIELAIDSQQRIQEVVAQNEDAKKIIGDMDLSGSQIEVGINALIGNMLKEGYIDELKNSLLVSVVGKNKEDNEKLRQQLSLNINEYLKSCQIEGSILSQTINDEKQLATLANEYHISVGKAELIQQLINYNSLYTFEDLKDLSVHELNILLTNKHVDHINVNGTANMNGYLTEEQVKEIVMSDAAVALEDIYSVELDYEDGCMVYEVELFKNSQEFDYEVDAITGEIIKREQEHDSDHHHYNFILTTDEAKEIALKHAGVSMQDVREIETDIDHDGYEISFKVGQYEYEYHIDGHDGTIHAHHHEYDD